MSPATDTALQAKLLAFENRLLKVYKHRSRIARKQGISCFRVYEIDLPEFPLIIDMYNDCVLVSEYKSKHKLDDEAYARWLNGSLDVIRKVLGIGEDRLFLKRRERQKGEQQYVRASREKQELIVQENGLSFIVNLSDYLDTGLFPDHRLTRQMLRGLSAGKSVLNLFAYTGSFSVYAAAGGAAKITTVDLSNTYINWAKRNMQYNKLYDPSRHQFIQADVLEFLRTVPVASYDLIILDPPTFSNSKRMQGVFDVQRDHAALINRCLELLRDNGMLIFSTNYRGFIPDTGAIRTKNWKDITSATTPFDFAGKLKRQCYTLEK